MDATEKPATASLGEWNGYVQAGGSREERRRRLDEVPEDLRGQVESHVKTVFALRRWHQDKARKA